MRFVMLGLVLLGMAGACSLNPQPIPPGATDGEDAGRFGGSSTTTPSPNASDAAAQVPSDASPSAIDDAGNMVDVDAGPDVVTGTPGDGGVDAPMDAPVDGPDDGTTAQD